MRTLRTLVAIALVCATCGLAAPPIGPDGDAFYAGPSPLPPGNPGDVVWVQPYTGDAALPSARRNLRVLYHSQSVAGHDVVVSGVVSFPRRRRKPPVISWGHGTTGGADICAPSRDQADTLDREYVRHIATVLDAWIHAGYVVVQTDFEGLGTPGDHPYLVGDSEMRGMVDLVRAARRLDRRVGKRWIAMGHSQGGHATLYAAARAAQWAPELRLMAAVAMAPGNGHSLIPTIVEAGAVELLEGVIGYVPLLFVGASVPGAFDPASVLTPAAITAARSVCATDLFTQFLGQPADTIVPDGAALDPVAAVFDANEPDALSFEVPTLITQGTADVEILEPLTRTMVEGYCDRGLPVTYVPLPGGSHLDSVDLTTDLVAAWVRDRMARRPRMPPSNCPE